MNYGAKDFLKARIEARRSNRIAAEKLLNEPFLGVSSLDSDRGRIVPAAVLFSHLVGGNHAV